MPTQLERSAATREKAIAATIDCLVERGYAGATIAAVAERAGISRGALSHQYPDKQRLVVDTIEEISRNRMVELVAGILELRPGRKRLERGLDELWATFTGPVYVAALEVYVAARTDDALREPVALLEETVEVRLRDSVLAIADLPSTRANEERAAILINTLRGIALLWATGASREPLERLWKRVRRDALTDLAG